MKGVTSMKERKPFVIFLIIVMALILLPFSAPAADVPAKGTPQWIEHTLDLDHQTHTLTYNETNRTYTLSIVPAVVNPVLPDYEGVSVCVPGVYVKGLDKDGNNIVDLYNPVRYIGANGTENPTWSRIMMGGVEGDIALVCSMNIAIRWKMAGGKDVILQWQWNGGHVPSDIFTQSFQGYVDQEVKK
jgi:hypothetical protein